MSNTKEKNRNLGIDILCCLGTMMLLGLSFFKVIGFAEVPIESYMAALPLAARWFCLSGAMVLAAGTGFVMSSRKYSASYFKILIRLVYIYLTGSACSLIIRIFLLQEEMTVPDVIQSFFSFTTSDAGIFVGMYFGLLLAAPFLNAAFHDLGQKRARLTFLVLTTLFSTLQPMLIIGGVTVIPEWCKYLFPVAAYIGGAYVKRYLKRRRDVVFMIIFLIALCASQTAVVLALSMAKGVMYCPWLDSIASLPCLCIALCLVGIFRSRKEGSGAAHRFFGGAAGGALSALMLGDPLLGCLLPALEERFPDISMRLWAGFGVIPVLFILCVAVGLILQIPLLAIRNTIRSYRNADEEPEDASDDGDIEDADESEEDTNETDIPDEEVIFEEAEEEEPAPRATLSLPPTYTQPLPQASENSSRHTITVPVVQPEMTVKLTQPPAEKPIGVHEVELPETPPKKPSPSPTPQPPKDYTLDDILSEQGIPVKHMPDSVDDLIAELTK